jgi:hypothetical protein
MARAKHYLRHPDGSLTEPPDADHKHAIEIAYRVDIRSDVRFVVVEWAKRFEDIKPTYDALSKCLRSSSQRVRDTIVDVAQLPEGSIVTGVDYRFVMAHADTLIVPKGGE